MIKKLLEKIFRLILISFENLIKNNVVESTRFEYKKSLNIESLHHTIDEFANDIDNCSGGYIGYCYYVSKM